MRYDDLVETARDRLGQGREGDAEVYAMLAIADRLDRLCEVMSKSSGRRF